MSKLLHFAVLGKARLKVLKRSLLTAADKLQWPLPVDYPTAKLEVRKEFESAFLNLLMLQELYVVHPSNFP